MALSRVLCPTLVGREAELSELEDALLSALRGEGGVVIVGGEAGTGKTRLVNSLAARARVLGCAVVSGACSEAELSLPYLPFLEAIGNHLQTEDLESLRERLGSAADELAQLFPQMGPPSATVGDATQAKLRLFESILLLLRDAARARALLLILEDIHWADPATRELLDYATRRLRSTNVLVLATYRSDELHRKHPLLPTIQGWRRSGQVELIELAPLGAQAVAEMVCAIFDESSISDEFRDFLHERSEGNPFVLEEILRDALDSGDIFRTDKGWDRKPLVEMRIPRTVKDAILQRLERLSREDVAVLSAASVMGRSFDVAALAAVADAPGAVVLSALEASVTAQLVEAEDSTSGRYRFRHALTREAIYEDMVVPRRQQLHSRVADVLSSSQGVAPVDLAHHLFMAGRNDEAVTMCVPAAQDAIDALAFHDAAELLQRAAPYMHDPIERGRLLCRAGDAYWNNTESSAARSALEHGIADLESAGLIVEAAGHRLLLGRCYWEILRTDLAREEFVRARDVLEAAGPSEALAIAYIRLSGLASFERPTPASLADASRAAEIAKEAGSGMALAWSWNFMAIAEVGLGRIEAGFKHLEASYRAAVEGGYRFQALNAVFNASWLGVHVGYGRLAQRWFELGQAPEWAAHISTPWFQGLVVLQQGQVREAIDLARAAGQRAFDAGHPKQIWRSSVLLAHALAENLQGEAAAAELPPLSSRVEGQDAVYDSAPRIRTKLAQGDPEGALDVAKSVSPDSSDIVSPADVIAEVAQSDASWLDSFLSALPIQGETLASPRLAAARGRLALYEGRLDAALTELRKAVGAFEDGGFMLDVWHVGRSLADAEARSGDVEAARRRLESIVRAAEPPGARLAAKLAREKAIELGIDLGGAPEEAVEPVNVPRIATGERMVSVLFADVRGYTEMSGREGPAVMAERIASLQRWAAREVSRRHGIVDKFAGDAVMATFNVSGQSVDHTLQALHAAIAIIDKAALAGLPVGAGLAAGPAVVGSLAVAANLSVLGEVTNLAARLQAQSSAGQVTLTEEAYRRTRDWIEGQRIPTERIEVQVKGFSGPVVAFRLAPAVLAPMPNRTVAVGDKAT
jgi:class 3 adenylate cyclase/tetratricopeptide (TPR) repeat protein